MSEEKNEKRGKKNGAEELEKDKEDPSNISTTLSVEPSFTAATPKKKKPRLSLTKSVSNNEDNGAETDVMEVDKDDTPQKRIGKAKDKEKEKESQAIESQSIIPPTAAPIANLFEFVVPPKVSNPRGRKKIVTAEKENVEKKEKEVDTEIQAQRGIKRARSEENEVDVRSKFESSTMGTEKEKEKEKEKVKGDTHLPMKKSSKKEKPAFTPAVRSPCLRTSKLLAKYGSDTKSIFNKVSKDANYFVFPPPPKKLPKGRKV